MRIRSNIPEARPVLPEASGVKQTGIQLVWIVPIVAALIAAYLVYNRFKNAGPEITITFKDGGGLQAGQTILRYRGVKVGTINSVKLSTNGQQVEVEAGLDRSAARLACEGSVFWIVRPEVNGTGLHGLETIVSGAYIQVEPGHGKEQKKFAASEDTPALSPPEGSLEVVLTTPQVGTLNIGAPVYYRGLEVGAVHSLMLNPNATDVAIHVEIEPRYASLVRQNTEFWNAGGLNVSLKLFGINVSAESVRSLIVGGIAFATPTPPGLLASSNSVYVLHEKLEEKWLKWAPPMPDWAGSNGPPTNASSSGSFPSVGSLTGTNASQ
jgi:paraquat-inducible protein B